MLPRAHLLTLLVLIGLPAASISYKIFELDYRLSDVLPATEYRVSLDMSLDGQLGRVRVRTFVPESDERQTITQETQNSEARLAFSTVSEAGNREAVWLGAAVPNSTNLSYSFAARLRALRYELGPDLSLPESYPTAVRPYLRPEKYIQVDAPEITARGEKIGSTEGSVRSRLQAIFASTSALGSKPFKGTTDALTALKLGEASCNGKSRLFVALARSAGIPARLVGGLVLTPGRKRTSHQWVEAYVSGHWVPFDPTNDHFAELPEHYLRLYSGDESLFKHTADVNFDYEYATTTRSVPSPRVREGFKLFNVWDLFARLDLPFGLLRTVLLLPIGALVVVLFRNVVGMPTFGTFLPALIAAAVTETGLLWGIFSIALVTFAVVVARLLIQRLHLLHSPTLAILLTVVVISMLGTSLVADSLGLEDLARVTYFPIAVMAIASERFYLALVEQGPREAAQQMGGTLLVVLACFVVMNSVAISVLVGGFPEVLLLVIAANIYLGRWVGIRLLEYFRFRTLLRRGATVL